VKSRLLILNLLLGSMVSAQSGTGSDSTGMAGDGNPARTSEKLVATAHLIITAGSAVALGNNWYRTNPRASFHFTNDMDQWLHMDKAGHAWSAYQLTRLSTYAWQAAAGLDKKRAISRAAIFAFSYQTAIELMDGFSSKWGFSWGDMGANIAGISGFVAQELVFKKQLFQLKIMSAIPLRYPEPVRDRANELFGHSYASRLLNDYNAQTYWASFNLRSLCSSKRISPWLNIAIGYGAREMYGEKQNQWTNKNGTPVDRSDIRRYSRWLLSPDIDFTAIRTSRKWLRTVLFVMNAIKLPAPAIELSKGKLGFHALLMN
jgi:hypothetical protein